MSNLYNTLVSLCDDKGITAYRMCKDVGIQPSIMTDLKMGRRRTVKAETATKIANYFDVSVEYLMGETDAKKSPTVTVYDEDDNVIRLDDETLELIDTLRSRPEMKMLFSVSSKATKEDIIRTVKIVEALQNQEKGNHD